MVQDEKNKEDNKEGLSIVDEAKKIRDEIRAENDRRESILKQEQRLQAERLLGSSAGQPQENKQLSEEELKKKAAMEYWKGTGIDEAIGKYNG